MDRDNLKTFEDVYPDYDRVGLMSLAVKLGRAIRRWREQEPREGSEKPVRPILTTKPAN